MAVRREKVLLELEDRFTNPMLRAAGAAKTLDQSLKGLDGSTVQTDRDMDKLGAASGSLSKAAVQSRNLNREIDRTSGRLRLLVDAAVLLGPALVPIGAIAVPALTGLASAGGAAALGVGTMVAAFQGVGEALSAVNEAALDPTTENLEAARLAMERLSPQARDMVRQLEEMRPAFQALRDAAAAGLFPGLSTALDDLDTVLPRVERILTAVGNAAGDVTAEFAAGLAGPRGREFLAFVEAEMPSALTELGRTAGNVAAGLGELWMAFAPLNRDVSGWLLDASRSFDDWAQGLSQTQGFREFVDYIRENGPRVAEAMGAIGNAVLQIVQAAAPLGGPTLVALEAVADVIAAVANSSAGPALVALAAGITLVSRAMKTVDALRASSLFTGLTGAAGGAAGSLSRVQGAGIAAAAGLTAATVAGNALVDMFREDLPGVQQLTGMLMDLSSGDIGSLPSEFNSLADSIERISNPSFWTGQRTSDAVTALLGTEGRTLSNATDEVEALEAALINMLQIQGPRAAENAFATLAADSRLTAEQVTKLRDLMPGYIDALAGAENQAEAAGRAGAKAGRESADGFMRATTAAQRFRNAIAAANRALEGRASVRDYEQAIDDLNRSIRQNGKSLDITTQKGRENQAALDGIAAAAIGVAENMSRTNRIKVLTAARVDLVDAAMKLGKTRGEARDLADRLLGLDKIRAEPIVEADTRAALAGIDVVESRLSALDGRTATVTTYHDTVGRVSGRFRPGLADGGTVGGSRYPYRDKVLAELAPGEEVISNRYGQADRNRELLKAINANRYAEGGTVGRSNISVGSPNVNVGGTAVHVFIGERELNDIAVRAANRVVNAQMNEDHIMGGGR